jgi:bifunctional non-homologous end joining protein LigD
MPRRAKADSGLEEYDRKRNFSATPEPEPKKPQRRGKNLTFVVQKHAASRLHYDFRLEVEGVLKSWAVPRGPSLNPEDKRLAVMTEDHPMSYADFEGVIPEGQYGAGRVIVWDRGVYVPDETDRPPLDDRAEAERQMRKALAAGKVSITMLGEKLRGSFTLVRTTRDPDEWLLIKHRDAYADPDQDITRQDRSVTSDKTLDELGADAKTWQSNRKRKAA